MALVAGTRLGAYEILSALGAGGMGEVHRARDTKLNRDVAIKVLPELFANDPERLARFEREAHVLASLNHPNIGAIYGFEHTDGLKALVLELVEGPTLADRLAEGPIPVEEALPIARQIAVALEAAHEQGIVHRDLKPANIKLRTDGTVKVLDFGLAKAMDPIGSTPNVAQSPTITSPAMTRAGIILGTAAYMSPEQAAGKTADKRSDLWAFGVVLLEMLTGQPAFTGETVSHVLASVLKSDPDWTTLPAETPPAVRRLLRRCLTRDRKRRLDSAAAAQLEIDDAETAPASHTHTMPAPRAPFWRKALPGATAVIVGLAAAFAAWTLKPVDPRAVTRFAIPLGDREMFTLGPGNNVALSPDGSRLAYTAGNRLYLRALDKLDAVSIAGGDGPGLASPRTPFFSADGQWVGFWQASQLKKVSIDGGAALALCAWKAPPFGATWSADNTILLGDGPGGIWRVSGNGGAPEPIVKMESGQRAHGPQLLPDGRSLLFTFTETASWDDAQIVVQSLESGTRRTVITGTDGHYLPTGHLIYALRDTVLAVPFDLTSLSITGGPKPLVEGVQRHIMPNSGSSQFVVSSDGTAAYVMAAGATIPRRTFVWVDRQGREEAIAAPLRPYSRPRLAPDGSRLAVEIENNQNWDIWIWDFQRGSLPRMTSDPSYERYPVWTPDGEHIIFSSDRSGIANLFLQAASGTGTADRLSDVRERMNLVAFTMSPDGKQVVFRGADGRGGSDLMILDVGDRSRAQPPSTRIGESRALVQTPAEEYNAEISPDGRWLAYQSNSSTAFEIYVRPFPDVDRGLWQVSTAGGTEPLWSRHGRELYYRAPTGAVMRVSIAPGSAWKASTPTELFTATRYALGASGDLTASPFRTYDVAADGRFLMMKNPDAPPEPVTAPRIAVVRNWTQELKRLVPPK
jgi:serine/threonine-protein kinase